MMSRFRDLLTVSLATAWLAGLPLESLGQAPMDVIGTLPLAEYNTWIAPPTYNEWGFEPCIAVNPTDPNKIIISSTVYNSDFMEGASLWYSTNGGKTWGIRFPIKNPPSGQVPWDQVYAYDSSGVLHGALLAHTNTAIYH